MNTGNVERIIKKNPELISFAAGTVFGTMFGRELSQVLANSAFQTYGLTKAAVSLAIETLGIGANAARETLTTTAPYVGGGLVAIGIVYVGARIVLCTCPKRGMKLAMGEQAGASVYADLHERNAFQDFDKNNGCRKGLNAISKCARNFCKTFTSSGSNHTQAPQTRTSYRHRHSPIETSTTTSTHSRRGFDYAAHSAN